MNKTHITGNVTKRGAELRRTQSGDAILSFSVGVSNGKDKDGNWRDKTFFDCSIWGKRGEALERYVTAGSAVEITGRVSCREHDGKAYLQISVDDFGFAPKPFQNDQAGGYNASQSNAPAGSPPSNFDDEIPFFMEWR